MTGLAVVPLEELARVVRAIVREELAAAAAPKAEPTPEYMRVDAYAARVGVSERTLWTWVRRGLPIVGRGRCRRVPVVDADRWLAEQRQPDTAIEDRARRAAATRAARGGR